MRPDELDRRQRERLDALGPAPRAELLHVLMPPDFEDASGRPSITTDADPAVIAAVVLVLGEGILFGLVLWAIGTIGRHVVELRKQAAPVAEQRPVAAPSASLHQGTYSVILKNLGTAKPDHVRRLIRNFTDDKQNPDPTTLQESDVVIASGLTYANAEPLRVNLIGQGAEIELREET